jgi:hypothetical protein
MKPALSIYSLRPMIPISSQIQKDEMVSYRIRKVVFLYKRLANRRSAVQEI